MNTIVIPPEVLSFVAAVRAQLGDLEADELLEITDGLEADLTELVHEQGLGALGDPIVYARELRAAAGLSEAARRSRRMVRVSGTDLLDACHERWDTLLARSPRDVTPLLTWLRPLWWVLRAWIAVQLVQLVFGRNPWSGTDLIPDLRGFGLAVLALAAAASIWLGLNAGRVKRSTVARIVVLVVNLGAVLALPAVASQVDSGDQRYHEGVSNGFARGYTNGVNSADNDEGPKAGLYLDGTWVSNIYAYDAAGRPMVGVQLFNQVGDPLNVITQPEYKATEYDDDGNPVDENGELIDPDAPQLPRIFYPWTNGASQLYNVFPLPSRLQANDKPSTNAFAEKDPPKVGAFPHPSVPRASLPGIRTGVLEHR